MAASALLILTSVDRDPDEVASSLGLVPFQSWRRGERKRFEKLDGSSDLNSVHTRSGWKARPRNHSAPLQEQVDEWLAFLRDRLAALEQLHKLGWESELNCFSAGTAELELEAVHLAELGQQGVRVSLFVLCSEGDGSDSETRGSAGDHA